MPQWVFLTQLFNDVIVKDRVALAASGVSTRVNLLRRVALGFVILVSIFCAIGFGVSYLRNRALLFEVKSARREEFRADQVRNDSDLRRLNAIGQLLDTLGEYHRNRPLSLRWGLYVGDDLYPQVCRAYADGLNQLVLKSTRASMVTELKKLGYKTPTGTESESQPALYDRAYRLLETYLISTNQGSHAKEYSSFISDLYDHWPPGRNATSSQKSLVQEQFNRYANGLADAGTSECFASPPDSDAVTTARNYLNRFPPDERIYQGMLLEASKAGKVLDFAQYADEAVSDPYKVPAAFTKAGWNAMEDALKHPERYRGGEQWVLGEGALGAADPQNYVPRLRKRYETDFIGAWLFFIKDARFAGYRSPADISLKIEKLAGARSALLMVLCVASTNATVESTDIKGAFSAVRGLAPPDCENKVTGSVNKDYTDSLFGLRDCLDKMNNDATPEQKDINRQLCEDKAGDAKHTVSRLVAANAGADQVDKAVEAVLSRPIDALPLKPPRPPGAGDLCNALDGLSARFPDGVSLDEFQRIFVPGGMLDKYPPGQTKRNVRYAQFFTTAADIRKALYPEGKTLGLHYTITALPSPGVSSFKLTIGSQSMNAFGTPKEFVWNGDPQERIKLEVPEVPQPAVTEGPFAIFKFVAEKGEPGQLSGPNYNFMIKVVHTVGRETGNPPMLKLQINAGAASRLFQGGSLAKLGCTPNTGQ